jgi:hypothetical protein
MIALHAISKAYQGKKRRHCWSSGLGLSLDGYVPLGQIHSGLYSMFAFWASSLGA